MPDAEKDGTVAHDYLAYPASVPTPAPVFTAQGQMTYSPEQEPEVFVYPSSMMMSWSPEEKKQQLHPQLQQNRFQHQHYQQKPQQLAQNLPELDHMKILPVYTPPPISSPSRHQHQQHLPMIHSPIPDHSSNVQSHPSHQIPNEGLFQIDLDDWNSPATLHNPYPHTHSHSHSQSVNPNQYPAPISVKQEDLTTYTSLNSYAPSQNYQHHQDSQSQNHTHNHIFDLSSHVPQNPHLPHPHSSFAHQIMDPYYDNSHHQHQPHPQQQQQFVHPGELSPPESPVSPRMEYSDGQGCNPRFVGGDLEETKERVDGWINEDGSEHKAENVNENGNVGESWSGREMGTPDTDVDLDAEGEDDDAEGEEDLDADACNDTDADADWDGDDGDFDPEIDDDDGDGEYVLRRGRRSSDSALLGESRNLRLRSATTRSGAAAIAARYNPYAYPTPNSPSQSQYFDQEQQVQPQPPQTRSRRTASSATASSSSNTSLMYPPLPSPLLSHDPSNGSHRRTRLSTSLSISVPVPVPNLTKKSRGRRVPTVASIEYGGSGRGRHGGDDGEFDSGGGRRGGSKGVRMYTCKVTGCGKCFARGEHLKRHVRSIHTYEKRKIISLCPWFHRLLLKLVLFITQRTNALTRVAGRISADMTILASTCAFTRTIRCPADTGYDHIDNFNSWMEWTNGWPDGIGMVLSSLDSDSGISHLDGTGDA